MGPGPRKAVPGRSEPIRLEGRCQIHDHASVPSASVQIGAQWSLALIVRLGQELGVFVREIGDGPHIRRIDGFLQSRVHCVRIRWS